MKNLLNSLFGCCDTPKVNKFCIEFKPTEDITTYELALALKFYLFCLTYKRFEAKTYESKFNELDEKIKRHFITRMEYNK